MTRGLVLDADAASAMARIRLIESKGASHEQAVEAVICELLASRLRLAQGLRVLRDTSSDYAEYVATRALEEAGIGDPPEEDHA